MIRSSAGKWEKENPEISEKLERSIVSLKVAVKRAEILSTLQGNPGWLTIQEILKEKIKLIDAQLKKFGEIEPRKVDILLEQKLDFEFMLNIVDDFTGSVQGFESAISRNEKELESRKQPTS